VTNPNSLIHSSVKAGAVKMSSSESDFCMVIRVEREMEGFKLRGSTSSDFRIGDELGIGAGGRSKRHLIVCGFCDPMLI